MQLSTAIFLKISGKVADGEEEWTAWTFYLQCLLQTGPSSGQRERWENGSLRNVTFAVLCFQK